MYLLRMFHSGIGLTTGKKSSLLQQKLEFQLFVLKSQSPQMNKQLQCSGVFFNLTVPGTVEGSTESEHRRNRSVFTALRN